MSLPAAERLANFAVTITGNPSDDTADGDSEPETVGLNAKDWDWTKRSDARKARESVSVFLRYWHEAVSDGKGATGQEAATAGDVAIGRGAVIGCDAVIESDTMTDREVVIELNSLIGSDARECDDPNDGLKADYCVRKSNDHRNEREQNAFSETANCAAASNCDEEQGKRAIWQSCKLWEGHRFTIA
jgi:hypothetical protein